MAAIAATAEMLAITNAIVALVFAVWAACAAAAASLVDRAIDLSGPCSLSSSHS